MALDNLKLQLLPRPKRSILSSGPELTRAIFPNFANVDQLRNFMNRIFNWQMTIPNIYIQLKAVIGLLIIGIIIVCLVLARRKYEGKLSIFRTIRKPTGTIIVPNPMLAFSFVEGICAIPLFAQFLLVCRYHDDSNSLPPNYLLWIILPWCILIFGVIWAVIGIHFATPHFTPTNVKGIQSTVLQKSLSKPFVVNSISTVLPLLISCLGAVPALMANQQWNKAHQMEREWQKEYSTALDFTSEMVQASQTIWFEAIKAMRYASIAFFAWFFFSISSGLIYSFVSYRLIKAVRADLHRIGTLHQQDGLERLKNDDNGSVTFTKIIRSAREAIDGYKDMERGLGTPIPLLRSFAKSTLDKSSQFNSAILSKQSIGSQRKQLRIALIHICIQVSAIVPGAVGLGFISLSSGLKFYSSLEQPSNNGGNQLEKAYSVELVVTVWLVCIAGAQSILAIAFKTYEPVFTSKRLDSSSQSNTTQANTNSNKTGLPFRSPTFFETQSRKSPSKIFFITEESSLCQSDSMAMTPTSVTWDIEAKTDSVYSSRDC